MVPRLLAAIQLALLADARVVQHAEVLESAARAWLAPVAPLVAVGARGRARSPVRALGVMADVGGPGADDELDAMIRSEIETAFSGLEEALASGDEEEALARIQSQGKVVMKNVLQKMDDDGKLLSSTLATQIEELASTRSVEMLKKYDQKLSVLQQEMAKDRAQVRAEQERLET